MNCPLRKRHLRELKTDFGKYMVIFLLMILSIGEVSGFLVADESMLRAYNESFDKYNIEDGHFISVNKLNSAQRRDISDAGITLYDLYYKDTHLSGGSTLRVFKMRDKINKACLMKGVFPEKAGQIAVDRMYADNNHIRVGDLLYSKNKKTRWKVTGLVALSDYSSMFEDNDDSMFDSVKFGVAVVCPEEFKSFRDKSLSFCYGWKYKNPPADEYEQEDRAEDLMKVVNSNSDLEEFIPRYENRAICFTGEDMGSDKMMMQVFLYIIIAIIAFVFGVTISNTITEESEVIGVLRASGYTKGELIRHYMAMPIIVTLLSAVIGNLLGYTILKDFNSGLYYGSYSLPTYVTLWNPMAFIETTVIPIVLMVLITRLTLSRKLKLSPLKFLRKDLRKGSRDFTFPLNRHLPFLTRFRIRIVLQNLSNYLTLFAGILFANMLLMFGLLLPAVLNHYQKIISRQMLCPYQYILQAPYSTMKEDRKLESFLNMLVFSLDVETDYENAEKFSAYNLNTIPGKGRKSEEIMLYGLKKDSRYIPVKVKEGQVYISSAYADKYLLKKGDVITLKEKYEDNSYSFTICGIYDYMGGLCIFMDQADLNKTFDLGSDYFSGYLSDRELDDINKKYISTVIDQETLTKISRQLNVSMGSMMYVVDVFSVMIFMILIYLLSKIIIEKNASAISMTKILGYKDGEISRLYILSTTIVVIIFFLLSLPLETELMRRILRFIMSTEMSGWIPFYMDPKVYIKMILLGFGTYGIVAFLEYKKIKGIPLGEALKNAE